MKTPSRLRSSGFATTREDGDADSIERIVGKGVEPAKRDFGNGQEHATGGDIADLELGDLSTPAPKYEANAMAGVPQTFWLPGHADGQPSEGPLPGAESGTGRIVKTVHMDQRYEGE